MMKIWKYSIDIFGGLNHSFNVPEGARLLHLALEAKPEPERIDNDILIHLWMSFDEQYEEELTPRVFKLYATGESIPDNAEYCGTVIYPPVVIHVCEMF